MLSKVVAASFSPARTDHRHLASATRFSPPVNLPGPLLAGFLGLVLSTLTLVSPLLARPTGVTNNDRRIALAVSMLLQRQHLSQQPLNDEISRRCMDTFLENLDPFKLYFYQADIDSFMANQDRLDDLFRRGDIQFAHTVFATFLQRVNERVQTATNYLDQPHDFTIDETMISEPDASVYSRTPEEAAERWRKRVKYDLLRESVDDEVSMEDAIEKLRKRYSSLLKRWEQTDNDELLELYVSSMTRGYDPHSSYMSPGTLENFKITMGLELEGIGASLRSVDGYTEVTEVIPGGAADRQGDLKKGDRIVGVGQGDEGEIVDIMDTKLNDVVKLIRGKKGTTVRLEINPVDNPNDREVLAIQRDRIELKNQEARSEIIEFGEKPSGKPYRLGVIQLPSFYMDMDGARRGDKDFKSTTRDVRRLLQGFKSEGIDSVVMDLRFNGGGSLTEAVNLTGLFIDRGPVVQVKGPDGRTQPYDDREGGMEWSGPLVVLINHFSASASEIFAGAIQDYRRGLIVGDAATHGKGTVQQLFDVGNLLFRFNGNQKLGALKMTIQQFYLPSGNSTQNRGVLADIELPSLFTHLEVGEADLDYALPFDKVAALEHLDYQLINAPMLDELRQFSSDRVQESSWFQKEKKRIARYLDQKERESVTLNRDKFLAEREEFDREEQEEETFEKLNSSTRPVFEMDGYGKEALSISIDYLRLLEASRGAASR